MENLEIIIEDFPKIELDKLVYNELKVSSSEVKSSHFYDHNSGSDIEFYQIKSFSDVLSPIGTGNLYLKQLEIGSQVNDVMIIFSFNEDVGDVTFNFSENELYEGERLEVRQKAEKILEYLTVIKDKFNIPKIRFGFEPATDDDTCLVELGEEEFNLEDAVDLMFR
ncbi:hypothetical protein ACFSVM_00790 [Paenibacillus shunpengii]|uniref:Uncharacterized protein n=1 Tax=Paenibacillus shunpengii TaxID=2054424 RepID=A0ABW5SJP1_9BACL|nr:hypothetical protein [Paenibacillus sp. FSL H7-0326]OMC72282.1 hypothetical protein BK126_09895 [Paenibacillus sp. FSL H7-0326]